MNNQPVIVKTPVFNLPLDGMLTFDKKEPEKLTVIFRTKSLEIDLTPGMSLSNKNKLAPMEDRFGEVHLNVTAKDGEVYRVKMKTESFTKITLLFIEQLPPVRLNPEMPKLDLVDLGLTFQEYEQLLEYYNNEKPDLESAAIQRFIRRKDSGPTRSIIYHPDGHFKGAYALLKSHGTTKEIGLGAFNLVTYALPLDLKLPLNPSQLKVFRSGESQSCHDEAKANELLINATDLYAVGVKFIYRGPIRSRRGTELQARELNQPKDFIPRNPDVEKIGYLLDYLEGGTYQELLEKSPRFSFLEAIIFNLKYAHALATMHNTYNTMHRDQKPENIFLTKDWNPKIGDFDFAVTIGQKSEVRGSALYSAPETLKVRGETKSANPSSDLWTLGLILLSSIGGINFLRDWAKSFSISKNFNTNLEFMINNVEKVKDKVLQDYRNRVPEVLPLILIIEKCLEMEPKKRLKAIDVFNRLGVIYYDLISENEKLAKNLTNQCSISGNII